MLHEPLRLHRTHFAGHSQPLTTPMMLYANGEPLRLPLLIQSVKGIYSTAADMMHEPNTSKPTLVPHTIYDGR